MCGRYVSPTEAEMERYWALTNAQIRNPLGQSFNVAPTVQVAIIYLDNNRVLQLDAARWGLIPVWWKQVKPPPFTFNARIEEAASKPIWRTPIKSSRCLVPAIGWYEWKQVEAIDPATGEIKKAKQPWFMHLPGNELFHFAGLMSRRGEGDDVELSCTILTKAAVGPAKTVHERMPVILSADAYQDWLDRRFSDSEKSLALAEEKAVSAVELHLVSSRVNVSKNQGADLIEPFRNPA